MSAHIAVWLAALLLAACGEGLTDEQTAPRDDAAGSEPSGVWRELAPTPREFGHHEGLAFWTGDEVLIASGPDIMRLPPQASELELVKHVRQAEQCEGCGYGQAGVWSGEELLMWGGGFSYASASGPAQGASFGPDTGRLRPIPNAPIPVRWWHTAVWTGREMIVWGGATDGNERADGAGYDPATNTWRRIADAPFSSYWHTAVWTGTEMIVWGGSDDNEAEGTRGCPSHFVDRGAAYDPESDHWRRLPPAPVEGRMLHEAVWTGTQMILWGGSNEDCAENHPPAGAIYDPARNDWRAIANAPIRGRDFFDAVWTGTEMILWGGSVAGRSMSLGDGAAYNPQRDVWRTLPDAPIGGRDYPALAWTGTELVVWGGCCGQRGLHADGAIYRP